jgi:hypothetical protein
MINIGGTKVYLGTQKDPILAARIYDIVCIQSNGYRTKLVKTNNSKTNFSYSKAEVLAILFERYLIEIKNQQTQAYIYINNHYTNEFPTEI